MLRVAQVMAGAAHGGAEAFYERLCIGLHQSGVATLPVIRRDQARAARLRAAGLPPVELAFGGPFDWTTTGRLRRALRDFAPDIVVSWMSRATAHMPRGAWLHVGRLGGYYDLRYYRRCDELVGNTHGIVRWMRAHGWAEARTHYLPNFADDFAGVAAAALPGAPGAGTILGLGRLHPSKGFDTLIAAAALLPGVRLVIAGAGPEEAALRRQALRSGAGQRIHFLGWRNDPANLLAACDVFVCSSRDEPLGNMIIEAWAAQRPVVACDALGPRELIRSGVDGVVVPGQDAGALAAAVRAVLADAALRARLVAAGRLRFEAEFSRARVIESWVGFLGERGRKNVLF